MCVCVGGMSCTCTCGQVGVASGLIVTSLMPHAYSHIGSPSLPYLLSNLHSVGFLDVTITRECLHICTGASNFGWKLQTSNFGQSISIYMECPKL